MVATRSKVFKLLTLLAIGSLLASCSIADSGSNGSSSSSSSSGASQSSSDSSISSGSESDSSSSSSVQGYGTVTLVGDDHVTLSLESEDDESGYVVIDITLEDGYYLSDISAVDSDNDTLTLTGSGATRVLRLVSSDVTVTAKSGDESVALDSAYQSLTSWTAERNVQVDYSAAFALGSYSYAYGISAKYDDEATVSTYSASGSATTDIWMYEDSANGALAERYLDPTTNQASYYDLSTSSGTAEWDSGVGLYYSTNPLSWLADGSYDSVSQNLDSKFNAYFSDDGSLTLESKSTEMSESDADLVGINNSALAFIYADEVIGSYVETVYAPTITITFGQGGTTIDSLSLSVPVTMPDVVSGSNIDLTYTVSSVSALAENWRCPR